jgi:hypothetical protein
MNIGKSLQLQLEEEEIKARMFGVNFNTPDTGRYVQAFETT